MIRFASQEETEELKRIWHACFSDPDSYVNSHYTNRGDTMRTLVYQTEDGQIVSMLDMVDITVQWNGQQYPAFYIYAASTLPDHQGKHYMHQLIEEACSIGEREGMVASILIPQTPDLVDFYQKQDYFHPITLNQIEVSASSTAAALRPVSELEFVRMKTEYEEQFDTVVRHSAELLKLIYRQILAGGGSVTKIYSDKSVCFAIYYQDKKRLMIQEISCSDESLEYNVSALCDFKGCRKALVSRPGEGRLYGLARELKPVSIDWDRMYMNTMLD